MELFATVPMQWVGPIKIAGQEVNEEVNVPLATYETPLWASTNRGAKVSRLCGGIHTTVISDTMARSFVVQAPSAATAADIAQQLKRRHPEIQEAIQSSSRFAQFQSLDSHIVGNLLYLRLQIQPGDASGHNMVTKAADQVMQWLLGSYPDLRYISISGNFCTDKKVSAVNSISGRGKYVVAESIITRNVCHKLLKTTPEAIVDCHIKKNLIGSTIAGSLCSANAHYANQLLAVYLATGQDAANIVEGSQGITHAECRGEDLYFSVTLPNLIMGTVGNGKDLGFVQENLKKLGCLETREPGANARRLAIITAAAVHCVELSLMAALTNPGELMRAHLTLERAQAGKRS
jgi:hydroxymethylglutaryl-CoA reductase (NADPH)